MLIYFAAPLFSTAERWFNERLAEKLETKGFRVFLPQRDGVEGDRSPFDQMSRGERRRIMFHLDRDMIFESGIFLFVLDGRVPDERACVELGMAYCHRELSGRERLLAGLQTDTRSAFLGSKLNPMLRVPLDLVAASEGELLEHSGSYRASQA